MKKKGVNFFLILLIVLVAVVIAKDALIRLGVEAAVKKVTGLPLKIDSLKVGLTTTKIDIRGLRVFNPPGFEAEPMIDIPLIYVDYSIMELLTGKIHLNDVRVEVHEFVAVVSKEGALNLNYLKTLQEKIPTGKPGEKPKEPQKAMPVQIDNLFLKFDRVVKKDYSKGGEPVVKEFPIGIEQEYKDIKDLNVVIGVIVFKAVTQIGMSNLPGLNKVNFGALDSVVSGTLKGATESGKKLLKETSGSLQKTEDTLKDTAGKITDIFKKK